jgi:uncharacterized protein YdeI (YjbR/CyaY-like superfamily)
MGKRDPRVDAYIQKSAEFARPILTHVREIVHQAVPEAEETIKWGAPHFEYKGVLCGLAGFKQHCNVIIWKASMVIGEGANAEGGPLRNITTLADLPPDNALLTWLAQAAELNAAGVKKPRTLKPKKALAVPAELKKALSRHKRAAAIFEKFPPSHKREYALWIADAKTSETRDRRAATAVDWIAGGKSRNWKYEKR